MQLKRLCGALLGVGLCSVPVAADAQTAQQLPTSTLTSPAFTSNVLLANAPLTLVFDVIPAGASVVLKVGVTDLSGLLRTVSPLAYVYPANEVPFATSATNANGESELVVSLKLTSGELLEVKRINLKIVGNASANNSMEPAPIAWGPLTPKFDIAAPLSSTRTVNTAADGSRTTTTTTIQSAGFQASAQLAQPLAGGNLTGNAQITGNSDRKQAMRYSTAQGNAEKIDLASYALEWKNDSTGAGLGNANFSGQHPLLWSSNNRGAFVTQKLGNRFDLGLAAQNATPLVGFPNALGLYNTDHHFAAAVIGVELLPERAKALRVEIFVVDAAQSSALPPPVPPDPANDPLHASTLRPCKDAFELQLVTASGNTTTCNTAIAPVSQNQSGAFQASRSRGFGARLMTATEDNALRADLAWAKSRHQDLANAGTPGTAASQQQAWQADVGYDMLKDWKLTEQLPLGVTTTAKLEYADPFYKSLSGPWQADYRQSTGVVNFTLGALTASVNDTRRVDNVARDASRMRNHTESQNFTLTAPFGQLVAAHSAQKDTKPDPLIPSLSLNVLRMKMFGSDVPIAVAPETVPNSITTTFGGTLNWTFERWTASYGATLTNQDNRQSGSEDKDQKTLGHTVNATWRPTDNLNLNANFAPTQMTAKDTGIVTTRMPIQVGANYNDAAAREGWTVLANVNYDKNRDNVGQTSGKTFGANLALGRKILFPTFWGRPAPGQIQLRYTLNSTSARSTDLTTLVVSDTRQKSSVVMLDLTMSLF